MSLRSCYSLLDLCSQRSSLRGIPTSLSPLTPLGLGSGGESSAESDVRDGRIDGMFRGWEGGTLFKLRNGQAWRQTDFACRYRFAYAPRVRIYATGAGYEMQVEGAPEAVRVRRVR